MLVDRFDYYLPEKLIAQKPVDPRDSSRLLVLKKNLGNIENKTFNEIGDYLNKGDVLVVNNTKVIPARLYGRKTTGAKVEIVLLKRISKDTWEALVRPGNKIKPGANLIFKDEILKAEVKDYAKGGGRVLEFQYNGNFEDILNNVGVVPLPPYIYKKLENGERYQTVYAKENGSAAAPTAGLHFTPELINKLKNRGVIFCSVLLHVGLGTFRPVKTENVEDHEMHSEYFEINEETVEKINNARKNGNKVVCVGTTSVRVLESVADNKGLLKKSSGWTDIFIYPGYNFKVVDAMITNFHLPKSTLLMLVAAFAGEEKVLNAYKEAVNNNYRFFSFGDAMLII
jgi:S-adenosylmethionine:tRNA ribosyltransferase-isomerase